jgi:formylglycine-generating enzyme required for sulfatase activity
MRRLVGILLLLLALAAEVRADAIDDRLTAVGLSRDEIYRKRSDRSWGEIFGSLFSERPFGESYALVVGVNRYQGAWPNLDATRADPARMRQLLAEQEGFDLVVTLENGRASKALIETLMVDVFPDLLGPDDRFLFYFSGHGTQRGTEGVNLTGYLPLTASGRAYSQMISMNNLRDWDRGLAPVKQVLFLLDSCFSGMAGFQAMGGDEPNLEVERLADYSHHIITAGTKDEQTIAGPAWNGSIFTDSLIRGAQGYADRDWEDGNRRVPRDGVVSLFELKDYINKRVASEAPVQGWRKPIRPQLYPLTSDNRGEFFFVTREKKVGGRPQAQVQQGEVVAQGDGQPSGLDLEPVEREAAVSGRTNVRAEPSSGSARIATLEAETRVYVRGKVKGRSWYLVERDGQPLGYVFENLLLFGDVPPVPPRTEPAERAPVVPQPRAVARGGPEPPHKAGDVFRGCPHCPEMVVVPDGEFMMGSPKSEKGRHSDEEPWHLVRIGRPFAIARFEVTFEEWEACVAGGGCGGYRPDDRGWGRGRRPVINVSWADAQAYVEWLSDVTGARYRLPSEAEWEYAARAGTAMAYWWGESSDTARANYAGRVGKTVEVGGYAPNPWGLYDTAGNVWEWVEDCWHEGYSGAPPDNSPWTGKCSSSRRVVRGGSWLGDPRDVRSAFRYGGEPGGRDLNLGFRVSRTLTP